MPSQTYLEVCFTNLMGASQYNQINSQDHQSGFIKRKSSHPLHLQWGKEKPLWGHSVKMVIRKPGRDSHQKNIWHPDPHF
jgi:hypothetical protein